MRLFNNSKIKIANLSEKEKKELLYHLETARPGFKFLEQLLTVKIQELDNRIDSIDIYDCPAYTHKRAHLDGAKRQLKYIKNLLTEEKEHS